jgi:hypothetical protein
VEELAAALDEFNAHARYPLPPMDEARLERLAERKVVRLRVVGDPEAPQTVAGLLVVELPRASVWAALQDPHLVEETDVFEAQLSDTSYAPSRWYQYIKLPWPFTPRQWVVDVEDTYSLAAATGSRCWEHAWDLHSDQERIGAEALASGEHTNLVPEIVAEGIWLSYNRGAWVVIELPGDRTLLAYHVATILGGNISDKLVADFSLLRMKKLMRDIEAAAWVARDHFVGDHAPLMGADGVWLSPPPAAPPAANPGG